MAGKVLHKRATEKYVHTLHSPADAQHRSVGGGEQIQQIHFQRVLRRVKAAAGNIGLSIEHWGQVAAAGKQQTAAVRRIIGKAGHCPGAAHGSGVIAVNGDVTGNINTQHGRPSR